MLRYCTVSTTSSRRFEVSNNYIIISTSCMLLLLTTQQASGAQKIKFYRQHGANFVLVGLLVQKSKTS